jgi:TIR domain
LLVSFDVFISYASKDKIVADAVCARLEAAGIRCWIAPRDIVPGTSYGEAIIDAIHGAKVMVLVFSSSANASGHIPKEVERAVSNGVAILPFRIEDVAPGKSLDYFIGSVHWLDAMTPPMEKHLDNLAATVHKLIPATGSEPTRGGPGMGASSGGTDATVMWQRGTGGAAAGVAAEGAIGTATAATTKARVADGSAMGGALGGGLSVKKIWIGVAAVVVLAALVMGMTLMHSGGSSGGGATVTPDTPDATNPAGGADAANDANVGGGKTAAPAPKKTPTPRSSGSNADADPIVGCYQWANNSQVVFRADGTIGAGPFTGHWRLVDAQRRAYTFTWPVMIETLTVSPDQRTMSGGNQYGYPISGGRMTGTAGLVGSWHWANGWNVDVAANGTFVSGSYRGTWRAVDASRGLYEMNWPAPVDSVVLLGGGTRVAGANQYGVATSGVKTGVCGGN